MQTAEQHIDYKVLYEQSQAVIEQLQFTVSTLKHEMDQMKKMIFGSKHERFVPSDNTNSRQLSLDLEAETIEQCKITDATKVEYIRTKPR